MCGDTECATLAEFYFLQITPWLVTLLNLKFGGREKKNPYCTIIWVENQYSIMKIYVNYLYFYENVSDKICFSIESTSIIDIEYSAILKSHIPQISNLVRWKSSLSKITKPVYIIKSFPDSSFGCLLTVIKIRSCPSKAPIKNS